MNLILIPNFGILGAAGATVIAEILWFGLAHYYFNQRVQVINLRPFVVRPMVASVVMAGVFIGLQFLPWILQTIVAVGCYLGVLAIIGEPEILYLQKLLIGKKMA